MKNTIAFLGVSFAVFSTPVFAGEIHIRLASLQLNDSDISSKTTSLLGERYAVTCFKTGEQTSGMNKICYYDCLGSAAAITISSVSLCPLTIDN